MSGLRPVALVPTPTNFGPAWAAALARWLESFVLGLKGDIEVGGLLVTESGRVLHLRTVTAATDTAKTTDEFVVIDRAGTVTETLPAGTDMQQGQRIIFQDAGNAGSNTITIARAGSDTINGGTSVTITSNYGRLELVWTGSEWLSS